MSRCFPPIIADAAAKKAGALIVMQSPRLIGAREEILKLASEVRLPVMGMFVNYAQAGCIVELWAKHPSAVSAPQ